MGHLRQYRRADASLRALIADIVHHLHLTAVRPRHLLLLIVCAAIGAGANVYRTSDWLMHDYARFEGFEACETGGSSTGPIRRVSDARPIVRLTNSVWRPLRAAIRFCGPPARTAGAPLVLAIAASGGEVLRVEVPPGAACAVREITLADAPAGDVRLDLRAASGESLNGLGVEVLSLSAVRDRATLLKHAAGGALCGALVWALLLMAFTRRPAAAPRARAVEAARQSERSRVAAGTGTGTATGIGLDSDVDTEAGSEADTDTDADVAASVAPAAIAAPGRRRLALVLIAIWSYLALWAVIKPPLQSPDEVQQLLRAASVLLQPWATGQSQMRVDPRFANPIAALPPGELGLLFFHGDHHLSRADVQAVKRIAWRDLFHPCEGRDVTGTSTYPTLYYGTVFALAEGTRALVPMTPYQATFLYRAWSLLLSGLLWLLVYRVLCRLPETAPRAGLLLAFLLLNPVLAFVSSAASPDAMTVPLGVLAILLMYRAAATGVGGWQAVAALVACGLTKPSAAPIAGGLVIALLVLSPLAAPLLRPLRVPPLPYATGALIAVARAGLLLFVLFYAWSPLRFQGALPHAISWLNYVRSLNARKRFVWDSYWLTLGWTDYALPRIWHVPLVSAVALNLACAALTLRDEVRRFALFSGLVLTGYVLAQIAGEVVHFETTGFNIIGRHFLPASIGVAALVLHRVRWARWIMTGTLVAMNLALIQLTVTRYYGGDWMAVWLALP